MDHSHNSMHNMSTTPMSHGGHPTHGHGVMANHQNHSMNMNHQMQMYFYLSKNVVILFKEWDVNTTAGLVGSCIGIFVLAALYEGLKVFREFLKRRYGGVVSLNFDTKVYGPGNSQTAIITETKGSLPRSKIFNWPHFLQTFLHMVQVTLSYFLMLVFMTYNGYVCIALVLGAGFGYFLFGWKLQKVVDIYEHCH